VEEGADLCLECGEPMGDSPAARAVRAEVVAKPAAAAKPAVAVAKPVAAAPAVAAKPVARKKWVEEPDPIRCPGCGIPSRRDRCPGCGVVLKRDDG
jgi:hypothetical protein